MQTLPSIELLESGHEFPGPYLFKVIGRPADDFVRRTVAAVRAALDRLDDPPYTIRESRGGRHVALTLEVPVASAREVLDVYRRVQELDGLVMLL